MASVVNIEQVPVSKPPPFLYRFTTQEYHRLLEAGVLDEDRVELLDGWLVFKMTHKPPHDGTVLLVQTELLPRLPPDWVLRVQSAISLPQSEPEPDLVVARGPARRYLRAHPRPGDIGLIVEVSETTLTIDRETKGRLYARSRIPVYWIVNLVEDQIEVYTQPRAGKNPGYRVRQDYARTQSVPLLVAGQHLASLPVPSLLP